MLLDIQIKKNADPTRLSTATVELIGSLDTATAPDLERALGPVLEAPISDLVFDLAGLSFISSAGLRVFGLARKRMKERGGQVAFLHMQPQIKEVFEIIKALPGLQVFRDTAEFDAYIAKRQTRNRDDD